MVCTINLELNGVKKKFKNQTSLICINVLLNEVGMRGDESGSEFQKGGVQSSTLKCRGFIYFIHIITH